MGKGSQRLLCPTLVARDDELAVLAELLANAAAGRGETILIGGDAGIGKTALTRRFAEGRRATASRVLLGECIEIEARRPLGPFLDAIEQARRAGFIRQEDADRLSPLLSGNVEETLQPRLYQAILRLFAGVARAAPLVLLIEDLHWADDASRDVFAYLARRIRSQAIVLIGTYRTDELHRRHPLRPFIAQLVAARAAREMTIAPLAGRSVTQFIRETLHLDRDPPATFTAAIDSRCEGNPFFMEETLEALRARGQLTPRDGSWIPSDEAEIALPDSVRDAVDRRLRTLTADTASALRVAAVIGQHFDFYLLARVSGIANDRLIDHLRSAIAAQLVVEHDAHGVFAFRHALTRESVMADLLEPERRALHLQIAGALEEGPARHEEALAYHYDAGGAMDKAFRAHLVAAEGAPFAAPVQSLQHLRRAVELAPEGEDLIALYGRLAAAEMRVDMPRGVRAYEDLSERARAAGRMHEAGAALANVANVRVDMGDPRSREDAQRAIAILEPLGPSGELANALAALARYYVFSGEDLVLGRATAVRGEEIARSVGDTRRALICRIASVLYIGDVASAAKTLRSVIDEARAIGAIGIAFRAYNNLFVTYSGWAMQERDALFEEWSRYAAEIGLVNAQVQSKAVLHWLRRGDFDQALRCAAEAGASPTVTIGQPARFHEAMMRVSRDGPSAGRATLEREDASSQIAEGKHNVLHGSAQIYLLEGEYAKVLAMPYLDIADFQVAIAALCAAHTIGDASAIDRFARKAEALRDRPKSDLVPFSTASFDRYAARYVDAERAFAAGDPLTAADVIDDVATMMERTDRPVFGTALRLRSIDLVREHDPARAQRQFDGVVAYWRKAKATWYLGELARWARERRIEFPAQAVPPSESSRPVKALTEREVEVARLVALGLTNKDIADRLVISERTAEGHVQRILDKLGFRSRSQIAAWHASGRVDPARERAAPVR